MYADTILVGGSVFDTDAQRSRPGGVAINGTTILAVGSETDLENLIGPRTTVVRTDGKLVIPGFQDAHVHPVQGGMERLQCDLTEATNARECLSAIRKYAADHLNKPWVEGAGWSSDHFPGGAPTREMLDQVVPDRPAILGNRDHHGIWVNSIALQLAGIDRHTPDPADGRIGRDYNGEPDGNLYEGAMFLVRQHQPAFTPEFARQGLLESQRYLHSFGVTSWQDAILGYDLPAELPIGAYQDADRANELTMRVTGCLWWERDGGLEQIPVFQELREELVATIHAEYWRGTAVKIMVDGVVESKTAATHEPYRDAAGNLTSNNGISFFDPAALSEYVVALDAAGFTVHFHALGDRAVTEALDAIAAARHINGDSRLPHHLAHIQLIDPSDIPRFKELGAVANMQMLWAAHEPVNDDLSIPFLSPSHHERLYPFGEVNAAGGALAAGSDWPVTTPDPLQAIHVGVNRVVGQDGSRPLGSSHQKLSLATAVTAYTAGSARVNGHDDQTGYLRSGLLADLAVIDRDLFIINPLEINTARVERTYVGGQLVYCDDR